MHHGILIKVRGDNEEDAKKNVEEIADKTIHCDSCYSPVNGIDWDYYTIVGRVDEDWIKKFKDDYCAKYDVKTPEDLAKLYRGIVLNEREKDYIKRIKEEHVALFNEDGEIVRHSMLGFYIKKLDAIRTIKEFGDADDGLYTLHCTDNHYSDMTEYTEGGSVYYFWVDRHW
jgi:hypothetical protein